MRQGIEILINYLFYERYTEIYSWKVVNFGNFCIFFRPLSILQRCLTNILAPVSIIGRCHSTAVDNNSRLHG